MKKLYLMPTADVFALKSADVITLSPFAAIDGEGDVEYIGYNGLTWKSDN